MSFGHMPKPVIAFKLLWNGLLRYRLYVSLCDFRLALEPRGITHCRFGGVRNNSEVVENLRERMGCVSMGMEILRRFVGN